MKAGGHVFRLIKFVLAIFYRRSPNDYSTKLFLNSDHRF